MYIVPSVYFENSARRAENDISTRKLFCTTLLIVVFNTVLRWQDGTEFWAFHFLDNRNVFQIIAFDLNGNILSKDGTSKVRDIDTLVFKLMKQLMTSDLWAKLDLSCLHRLRRFSKLCWILHGVAPLHQEGSSSHKMVLL